MGTLARQRRGNWGSDGVVKWAALACGDTIARQNIDIFFVK